MQPAVAYLSDGKLFLQLPEAASREVQSTFAQQVMQRQARHNEVHGWRSQSAVWGNMGMAAPEMSQWEQVQAAQRTPVRIQGVAPGEKPGDLYYVLAVGDTGGLFHYSGDAQTENRLMHRNGFPARDISRRSPGGEIAVSVQREDGTAGIQVGESDGRFLRNVTDGDALDEAPSWVPGEARKLVYQSAGVGRNEQGFPVGLAPYRVEQLDLDKQDITTVREEDGFDLLQPRMTEDGTLYCIRRPYEPTGPRPVSLLEVTKDVVLFPFRLARAGYHFLNFISVMFSGKPLSTAAGPQHNVTDTRYRMIWGRMIDTKAAMKAAAKDDAGGLVPDTWQLVRRAESGEETILARRVVSYDVCDDGIVYTDGSMISLRRKNGEVTEIGRDRFIERVVACATDSTG